jgi:hypothetical protein
MTVITKSGFPRPKFIISDFSQRVNCEKCMSCKYFTLFLSLYLTIATTKIKTLTDMAWKTAREKWLPNSSVSNVRKGTHTYECLLSTL